MWVSLILKLCHLSLNYFLYFPLIRIHIFLSCLCWESVQQAFVDLAKSLIGDWLLYRSVCLFSTWTTDSIFVCNRRLLTCFFQVSFFFADWINRTHKISQLHNKFGSPYETHLHFCWFIVSNCYNFSFVWSYHFHHSIQTSILNQCWLLLHPKDIHSLLSISSTTALLLHSTLLSQSWNYTQCHKGLIENSKIKGS